VTRSLKLVVCSVWSLPAILDENSLCDCRHVIAVLWRDPVKHSYTSPKRQWFSVGSSYLARLKILPSCDLKRGRQHKAVTFFQVKNIFLPVQRICFLYCGGNRFSCVCNKCDERIIISKCYYNYKSFTTKSTTSNVTVLLSWYNDGLRTGRRGFDSRKETELPPPHSV
jgi:hypothetical protein